jgi:hypothetical protein
MRLNHEKRKEKNMKSKFFKSLLAATMVLTMTPVSSVAA